MRRPWNLDTTPAQFDRAGCLVVPLSSFDALIGLTAAGHGAELRRRDQRDAATSDALGVPYRLVGGGSAA